MFFCSVVLLLAWIMAGWPIWLAWRARRHPKPFRADGAPVPCTAVICVRNGEAYLRRKLESLLATDYPKDLLKILVVSDGSTDATERIAQEFAPQGVRLLSLPYGGKSAALNAALPLVETEFLLITDVRQPLEPSSIRRLMAGFADPQVGVISGELIIVKGDSLDEVSIGAYWRFESWIRRNLSAVDSMLGATGPFYAMRTKLVRTLPEDTLLDDVYLPLGAFFEGYRLVVAPDAQAFDFPTSAKTEFRRKVRTMAGNYQLLKFYPQLVTPKNRLLFDYLSYKLGRLLLPFLLVALLVATFWLESPWRTIALAVQAGGYLMALLDRWIPEGSLVKRLTSPANTFLTMMLAAVAALSVWFVPAKTLWKPTQTPVKRISL